MKKALAGCLLASTLGSASIARADDDHARVHIKSEKHVQLESRPSPHDAWLLACESPCDRDLPLANEYRVVYGAAAEATRGDTFRLAAAPGGAVTVTADEGSTVQFAGGVVMAVGGVALAVAGLFGVAAVASAPSSTAGSSSTHTAECSICGGGLGDLVTLVSVVALVAGGGAILTGALLVNDAGPSTSQKPVFAREPTWVAPRAAAPDRRAFVVPLSFSF
jgi:hypothetical protein